MRYYFATLLIAVICIGYLFPATLLRAEEVLPTSVEVKVSCGDGLAEHSAGEICDPGFPPEIPIDTGSTTCKDFTDIFGSNFKNGVLGCAKDCHAFATSTCYTCGNGHKESVEECDSGDFGGTTCITWGFSGGSLLCTADCRVNTMNCEIKQNEGGTPGSGKSGGSAGTTNTGYNPGTTEPQVTKVVVKGKAYPHAEVHILIDGVVIGIVDADAKADFYFESSEITPGVASFGFWSEDKGGLKSTLLTLTLRVISGAVTTITGVNIAPSIDIDKTTVKQGEKVKIFGQTVPDTKLNVYVHSNDEHIEETKSTENGNWEIEFDTTPLEVDFHTAKALFVVDQDANIIKSGFSRAVSFYVGKIGGEAACPEADLNHDKRVNLTDFSILLYNWGKNNECADQNQNGTVDLVDFSIMMYYWTG